MYRGTGQGSWDPRQTGNAYPPMQQYEQPWGPERSNAYRFSMEQRHEAPGFAQPQRMAAPVESVRNPWESSFPGPPRHANFYKNTNVGFPSGQYPSPMEPKVAPRHHPSNVNAMMGRDWSAQMQNPYQQTNMPAVETGYDGVPKGQLQPQYSSPMRNEHMRLTRPGMEYSYSRGTADPQHRYASYPRPQFSYSQGNASSYPHAGQPTSAMSPRFQNTFQSPPNAMPYSQQNRYSTPAGMNAGMMSPVPKQSSMRSMVPDQPKMSQVTPNNMPGYSPYQDGKRPSYDASLPQMRASVPGMVQQQTLAQSAPSYAKSSMSENFNLDSLLDDSAGSTGSFMQQLEDIVPDSNLNSSKPTPNSASLTQTGGSSMPMNFPHQRGRRPSQNNMTAAKPQMPHELPRSRMPQMNEPLTPGNRMNVAPGVRNYQTQNVMHSPPPGGMMSMRTDVLQPVPPDYAAQHGQNVLSSPQRSLPLGSPEAQRRLSPYQSPHRSAHTMEPQSRPLPVQAGHHPSQVPVSQLHHYQHSAKLGRSPQRTPMMSPPPQHHGIPRQLTPNAQVPAQASRDTILGSNFGPQPMPHQYRSFPTPDQTAPAPNQQTPQLTLNEVPNLVVARPSPRKLSSENVLPVPQPQAAILPPQQVLSAPQNQPLVSPHLPEQVVPPRNTSSDAAPKDAPPPLEPGPVLEKTAPSVGDKIGELEPKPENFPPPPSSINMQVTSPQVVTHNLVEKTVPEQMESESSVQKTDIVPCTVQPEADTQPEANQKSLDTEVAPQNAAELQQQKSVTDDSLPKCNESTDSSVKETILTTEITKPPANAATSQPGFTPQSSDVPIPVPVSLPKPEVAPKVPQEMLKTAPEGVPTPGPTPPSFAALPHPQAGTVPHHPQAMPQSIPPQRASVYPPVQHAVPGAGAMRVPHYPRQGMMQVPHGAGPMPGPRPRPGQVVHHTQQNIPLGSQPPNVPHHQGQNVFPQQNPVAMQGANRMPQAYPQNMVYPPGHEGYRPHEARHFPPQSYGPQNRPFYRHPNYRMQPPGPMMPPHARQQFRGPPPRPMHPYPYSGDGNIPPGWHGLMHGPMNRAEGVHPGADSSITDKAGGKKKATGKDGEGTPKSKKEKLKKALEKKNAQGDSSEGGKDSANGTVKATSTKSEKKRKKPPATFKMKKKKQKKSDDVDDFDSLLPADAAVDSSLVEKRRSARNVKRKQYVENFDYQLSDEMSDSELDVINQMKAQQVELRHAEEAADDQMIVEKILDMRLRRVKKANAEESEEKKDEDEEKAQPMDAAEDEKPDTTEPVSEKEEKGPKDGKQEENSEEQVEGNKPLDVTEENRRRRKMSKQECGKDYMDIEEFLVKYKNYSYLHCEWKTKEEIKDKRVDGKIKRYKSKMASMPDYLKAEISEAFNPDFVEVERVLDVAQDDDEESGKPGEKHYFIKWCSLPYEDSTWEQEGDVPAPKIREFEERCKYRPPLNPPEIPHKTSFRKLGQQDAIFLNNNELRDYQLEGINWLLFNWYNRRNCILADEMGLGKTVQSITFLQKVFDHRIEGPFLVVAPLSTIANWQREFASWTNMNAVVYHGSQTSRDMIKTYEFLCRDENLDEIPEQYKMHAVITTYEMIVLESSHLVDIEWKCAIIDEAHRLKNQSCKLADSLRSMHCEYKVLLTGTPLQNNVEELFALLNFLQPEMFSSTEAFIAEFGDMKDNAQVEKLQELLKPMMLRRLKEDVEKSLAPKQETIIEVELTSIQKKYYRAIMERNFEFLSKGTVAGNIPNLMNTMMELRKCCNHPYLIKGAEDKIHAEQDDSASSLQTMIQSSGKLVLIDKLLPRLKSGGHKVLIFSQMVRCLDILEDYLVQSRYSYERIDGGIRGSDRQAAIDRFSKPDSERFVFLLCTRAGGLGINLTAADTVIIFDSDWNPQNDLQAQARCHRIGQTKTVKIYRLITRNSYEREMFDKASLKLGLDKAVLQSISGRQDDVSQNAAPALSKQEVENLLKLGAYGAIMDENDDANKFCEEDIDQILLRRTQTITIAPGQKGSTFSKASFISGEEGSEISLNDPNFWEKWAKKADLDIDRLKDNKLIIEEPRRRKQTRRFGGMTQDAEVLAELGSDSDSDYSEKVQSRRQKNKSRMKNWSKKDYFRVEKSLLTFGWGRWKHMLLKGGISSQIKAKELETVCRALLMYCLKFYNGDDKIKIFMWNLITPSNCSASSLLSNLEGLTTPTSRSRKGQSAKEDLNSVYDRISQEWIKEVDVNAIFQEDGFKKHLQHHCNKIVLRVRMLHFLQTEILGSITGNIDEISADQLELNFPDIIPDNFLHGWDFECDKSLLFGVHKHGFGKYSLIRADTKLCFLKKFGMPDDKSLADDLEDLVEEDNEDPEYKPAKLNFSELSEFEDSPASNTPGTAPASPASSIDSSRDAPKDKTSDGKAAKEDAKKDDGENSTEKNSEESNKESKDEPASNEPEQEKKPLSWPTASELNMRVRRIVSCYQKQHKHIRSRLMGLDQNSSKTRLRESSMERTHWTRREESDFYRTVSTFGVEYTKQGLSWTRFRKLAKLDKKSDRSLEMYYLAFKAMCERACGHKAPLPEEIASINVTRITEERASRTLYRIELLNRIRLDVLQHKNLDERLKKCERSVDLPAWWRPGHHDKELLLGMDKHGVTRTEIHILNDRSLSFFQSVVEFEQNQIEQRRRKRSHSPDVAASNPDKKMKGDDSSDGKNDKSDDVSDKSDWVSQTESGKSPKSQFKKDDVMFVNPLFSSQKWPKDRVLIQRIEHVCYCVIHGKWPISRMPDESTYLKTPIVLPTIVQGGKSQTKGIPSSREQKLLLDAEGHLLDKASSKILNILAGQGDFKDDSVNFFKGKTSSPDILATQKLSSVKPDPADLMKAAPHSEAIFNLCMSNSKFSETLHTLLKSDLSRYGVPQKKLSEAIGLSLQKDKLPPPKEPKEKTSSVATSEAEKGSWLGLFGNSTPKKKEDKGIIKKKSQKSKAGFISPAVLPPDSRIPVYNPTEKKKLVGEEAPLNKDLADWLKQHRGYVVDYKTLRENLSDEPADAKKKDEKKESPSGPSDTPSSSSESLPPSRSSSSKESAKAAAEHQKSSERNASLQDDERTLRNASADAKAEQALFGRELQEALNHQQANLNQSLMNPALLNSLYGTSPDMSALLANGLLTGLPGFLGDATKDPLFHQSSQSKHENHGRSNKSVAPSAAPQLPDMSALFGMGGMQNPADMATLAALFGSYAPMNMSSKDMQKQLQQLMEQQASQFDPKSLQFGGLGMPPIFPGMPGAMNPLFGMYAVPELAAMPEFLHPLHAQALLDAMNVQNEYAKLKDGNNLNAIQDLISAQHMIMENLGFNINNPEFQKFLRSQEALQAPSLSHGKTPSSSSGQTNDFDDNLRSVYQQLHSSSLQKELYENRKKEKADHYEHERKASPEDSAPVDLRRSEKPRKKS